MGFWRHSHKLSGHQRRGQRHRRADCVEATWQEGQQQNRGTPRFAGTVSENCSSIADCGLSCRLRVHRQNVVQSLTETQHSLCHTRTQQSVRNAGRCQAHQNIGVGIGAQKSETAHMAQHQFRRRALSLKRLSDKDLLAVVSFGLKPSDDPLETYRQRWARELCLHEDQRLRYRKHAFASR